MEGLFLESGGGKRGSAGNPFPVGRDRKPAGVGGAWATALTWSHPRASRARDRQGGVGLLQGCDRTLRGGRRAVTGRGAAGARARAPGGRAAQPGDLARGWAHLGRLGGSQRGAAARSQVPGRRRPLGDLAEARQAGVRQRGLWTPGRSTLQGGERPVNARGVSSRQKFQTGLEAPPRRARGPAPAWCKRSGAGSIGSASRPACAPRSPRPRSLAKRFQCAGAPLRGPIAN